MRVRIFCCCLFFILSVNAGAQHTVQLSGGMMRLDTLLNRVSRQTHQHFSLNTKKVMPATTVNWKAGKYTLDQFLQKLCATYAITYSRSGQHIILRELPKKTAATVAAKKPATPKPVAKKTVTVKPKAAPPPVSSNKPEEPVADIKKDTVIAAIPDTSAVKVEPEKTGITFLPVKKITDSVAPVTVKKIKPAAAWGSKWWHPFVQTGIAADDLFYVAPTLKGGFKFAYGILSWNSNFKIAGFRYGGGTSLRINDNMRLHADITFGKLARDYDTAGQERTVKTRLTRVQVLLENRIAGKFYLQYGTVLNLLKTQYYLAGISRPLYRTEEEADRKYHYLKPIYTLRNTYADNAPSNRKTWIGAQIGIYYRFK
ncbi:hypothetical protein [Terrimonas ferruginea]|uniref:hypothetical protein n=1 Tax=Terrimonas ferruginea TaxID=249 RepID=UPI000A40D764|nr:hypothetical protein [Terrimonas ferruginea]